MNVGWILVWAAAGQVGSDGWQVSDWANSQVAPSQYAQPVEVSPNAAARYGNAPYTQPVVSQAPSAPGTTGVQIHWPAIRPTPQPGDSARQQAAQPATQPSVRQPAYTQPTYTQPTYSQPASPYPNQPQHNAANTQPTWPNNYSQPAASPTNSQAQDAWGSSRLTDSRSGQVQASVTESTANSKSALAAEYQAQIDDRWSYYSEFYRQPNPQLPTHPAQPSVPQYQNQTGVALASQPAAPTNPYGNNWGQPNTQPNYSQPVIAQPGNGQANVAAANNTYNTQPPPSWPSNIYQPQPRLAEAPGKATTTISDSRGTMTLEPPLNSTLPGGRENQNNQFSNAQPARDGNPKLQPAPYQPVPRTGNNQTEWPSNNTNGNSGQPVDRWDNNAAIAESWNQTQQTAANVQNGTGVNPQNVGVQSGLVSPPATGYNANGSNFNPQVSDSTTTAKTYQSSQSNLFASLTPKPASQSASQTQTQFGQNTGGAKGGNLFPSAGLGPKAVEEFAEEVSDELKKEQERPWGVVLALVVGLFLSLGGNVYLGWIFTETYFRYRRLLIEGDDDDDRRSAV